MSAGDGWLQGIDVSKWQPTTPDLTGVYYLIARAGLGTKPDPTFQMHLANAHKAGVPVLGSYWYNIGTLTVAQEVDAYIAAEKAAGVPLDIHVIDWEGTDGFTAAQTADFIKQYRAASGNAIWLYASESRFRDLGQDHNWIANYSQEPQKAYDIWQYGPFHGADGNRFPGTLAQLKALVGQEDHAMDIIVVKAEDWQPTKNATTGASNGVFRSAPERAASIVDRVPLGTVVRSIAEVTGPAGDNWRLTERLGTPAYMLRTDWDPIVPGGDPTVDTLLTNVINRAPVGDTTALQAEIAAKAATITDQSAKIASLTTDLAAAKTHLTATYSKIDALKG